MKTLDYFTDENKENIYIEEMEHDYRVWHKDSIVDECLDADTALEIANHIIDNFTLKFTV